VTETSKLSASAEAVGVRRDGGEAPLRRSLAGEHRLALYVDGAPFAHITCTRALLRQLALGRLCTEGRITETGDVLSLRFSEDEARAEAALRPGAGSGGQRRLPDRSGWQREDVFLLAAHVRANMPLHDETFGTHGAAILRRGRVLCCCEDIGRHNAIDKAVGAALALGVPRSECVLYTTGRIAVDIVRKTAAAGVPVLASRTLPTAEAVQCAASAGLTLIGRAWETQYEVFTR
jgi:FdhD protein